MSVGAPGLCVVRGGGDLATGVAWRLTRAGWPVVVCELRVPLAIRRTVSVSSAVTEGEWIVEGMRASLAADVPAAVRLANEGVVAVLVSPELPAIDATVVIDARLAKRNIDTTIDDAPLVVGLGPGFTVGVRLRRRGRDPTGPSSGARAMVRFGCAEHRHARLIGGRSAERVVRAPAAGTVSWQVSIGDLVEEGQTLGRVGGIEILAPFVGIVRGLIHDAAELAAGMKIGDIDPRRDPSACHEISDKALAIGGGVVEAVLSWPNR